MKCITPEISWHNRDPVLSVDIQNDLCVNLKGETFWRVATGGADCHVLVILSDYFKERQKVLKRFSLYFFFNCFK